MKTIVILVYLFQSNWAGTNKQEYIMPDMETCLKAVASAKISNNNEKASVTVFCATKG